MEKNIIRQNASFARYFLCLRATTRQASETSTLDPGAVGMHVKACYFSTTARWATPPTWGPSRLYIQTLDSNFDFLNEKFRVQIFETGKLITKRYVDYS